MKHNKQMLAAGVFTAAVFAASVFALSASAQNSNGDESLASKIASKFNLNKEEVQAVLNEHRTEHRAEHQEERKLRLEERLTQAVADGNITEEQKAKILEFHENQQSFFDSLEGKTREERHDAMENHREEMKKWAEDNGIDEKYVLFGGGMGRGHGHMEMKGGEGREDN